MYYVLTSLHAGGKYTEEKMAEVQAQHSRGQKVGGLIAALMANPNISKKEILSTLIDLMGAAVDTVLSYFFRNY